jgi:hypothetical protein
MVIFCVEISNKAFINYLFTYIYIHHISFGILLSICFKLVFYILIKIIEIIVEQNVH